MEEEALRCMLDSDSGSEEDSTDHKKCIVHFSKVAVQLWVGKDNIIFSRNLFYPMLRPDRKGTMPMKFPATIKFYSFFNKNDTGFLLVEIDEQYNSPFAHMRNIVDKRVKHCALYKVMCTSQQVRVLKLHTGFDIICDIPVYVLATPGILTYDTIPSLCCRCSLSGYLPYGHLALKPGNDTPDEQTFAFAATYVSPHRRGTRTASKKISPARSCSDDNMWDAIFSAGADMCNTFSVNIESSTVHENSEEIISVL